MLPNKTRAEVKYLLGVEKERFHANMSQDLSWELKERKWRRENANASSVKKLSEAIAGEAIFSLQINEMLEDIFAESITLSKGDKIYKNFVSFFRVGECAESKEVFDSLCVILKKSSHISINALMVVDVAYYAGGI